MILDLGPASKGHALILPKAHAANIYEISDELAAKAMILAKKMARVMTDALHCDGFNIVQNNGECAGQTVFHFHMHLIPRYNGDSVGITWTPGTLTDEAKEEILKRFCMTEMRQRMSVRIYLKPYTTWSKIKLTGKLWVR